MTREQYELLVREYERELDEVHAHTIKQIERLYMAVDKVEIPSFINKKIDRVKVNRNKSNRIFGR